MLCTASLGSCPLLPWPRFDTAPVLVSLSLFDDEEEERIVGESWLELSPPPPSLFTIRTLEGDLPLAEVAPP